MKVCVRCTHPEYCHRWRESVRLLTDPPVCHRYEPPAGPGLRLLNRLLAWADRQVAR
jgi:hypothetical protein